MLKRSLIGLALAGTTALPSLAEEISWIYCGDKIDPAHEKAIADWQAANEGWTVAVEVVGWAQCQDKATTLAAAGSPAALAYVGSRTLKEFALNDLIVEVPMSDEEKAAYYP
ncbi:MAG: ABC transporter substrate-binding protein, partial [Paracoccus sp. (in: a-proteobacteria)]